MSKHILSHMGEISHPHVRHTRETDSFTPSEIPHHRCNYVRHMLYLTYEVTPTKHISSHMEKFHT